MITLDQSRIDAPDFPRSQEWWNRFLPGWMTAVVQADGLVTIEPLSAVEAGLSRREVHTIRRKRELAVMRWLLRLRQLEPAIVEDPGERCGCWRYPVRLHDGHCCFREARICHSMPADMRQPGDEIPAAGLATAAGG